MSKKYEIRFHFVAAGCITRCMHCARIGRSARDMPMEDIELIFKELAAFKTSHPDITIYETPMFEVMAHSDPSGLHAMRIEHLGELPFPGISSSGVAIGRRDDWKLQLSRLKELGVDRYYLSVHGLGKVHDFFTNCPGGYRDFKTTVSRIREEGLFCGTNVYLNKENLSNLPALVEDLKAMGLDEYYFGIPVFLPHARARKYEEYRPELGDVLPDAELIASMDKHPGETWSTLETGTETAWAGKAASGEDGEIRWEDYYDDSEIIEMAALENLDVYDGDIQFPSTCFGNIRRDGLTPIFEKAIEAKENGLFRSSMNVRNYFDVPEIPGIRGLAEEVAVPGSERLHLSAPSVRMVWLDRKFANSRLL